MALARKPWVVIDAEILSSSVWSEKPHVRLVWLTLLILCDTEGYVGASIPGIASAAGVTREEAEFALERLQSPDPYSRTRTNDGRRVAPAERGWQILNFMEHIDRLSSERAAARARTKRWRDKKKKQRGGDAGDVTRNAGNSEKGIGSREKGKENSEQRITDSAPIVAAVVPVNGKGWSAEACDDWQARFNGTAPGGQIGKCLKPLVAKHGWPRVRAAWQSYLAQSEAEFASANRFAATFGRWDGTSGPGTGKLSGLAKLALSLPRTTDERS